MYDLPNRFHVGVFFTNMPSLHSWWMHSMRLCYRIYHHSNLLYVRSWMEIEHNSCHQQCSRNRQLREMRLELLVLPINSFSMHFLRCWILPQRRSLPESQKRMHPMGRHWYLQQMRLGISTFEHWMVHLVLLMERRIRKL